jgi:hypothetical protein
MTEQMEQTEQVDYAARRRELADLLVAKGDDGQHDQSWWLENIRLLSKPGHSEPIPLVDLAKSCGTTACAAGWAVLMYGPRNATARPNNGGTVFVGDRTWNVSSLAEKLLGLTPEQGAMLWYASRSKVITRLRYLADNPSATSLEIHATTSD